HNHLRDHNLEAACRATDEGSITRPRNRDEPLAPVTGNPPWSISRVLYNTMTMQTENRSVLLDAIRAQPVVSGEGRGGVDRPYHRCEPGFGAVLLELTHSRNLKWPCTAKALHAVTRGQVYLAVSTAASSR
ncbi:hypothetical protein, partial [Kitasatospora sp. NPDC004289]